MRTHLLLSWLASALLACTLVATAGEPISYSSERASSMSAQQRLAEAQRHLDQPSPNLSEARLWLEDAAKAGSVEAMGAVGWLYEQGLGVPVDAERALEYYSDAYRAGENEYGLRIGWMHIQGNGVEPSREIGEAWFRRVITERDDSSARLALASLLLADAAAQVEPNPAVEARDLLLYALEDGILDASYYLAQLYSHGLGPIAADRMATAHFTRIGANAGHPRMQTWLAHLHLRGEGVPLDRIEAFKWASLAAAGGDPTGEQLRRSLQEQLDQAEADEARHRALRWFSEAK